MKINVNGKQNKKKKLIYEKERRIGVELKIKCTLCFKAKKKWNRKKWNKSKPHTKSRKNNNNNNNGK